MYRISAILLCCVLSGQTHTQERIPWTVEDQIAIERLPSHLEGDFSPPFHYNPAGDLVAFVILKPHIQTDETEARLRVFKTSDLGSFASGVTPIIAQPVFEYSIRSSGNRPGISDLRWTRDGAILLFLVQNTGRRNALYRWKQGVAAPSKVLGLDTEISTYDLLGTSDRVAVYSVPPTKRAARSYAPELVNGRSLYSAISNGWTFPYQLRPQRVHVADLNHGTVQPIRGTVSIRMGTFPSPNGRYVALTAPIKARWTGACWLPAYSPVPPDARDSIGGHELQYALIDVERGTVGLPMRAPAGFVSSVYSYADVVWSTDGTRAILPFTFSEADRCQAASLQARPGIFELTASSLQVAPIYSLDGLDKTSNGSGAVQKVTWNSEGDFITLDFTEATTLHDGGARRAFKWTSAGWIPASPETVQLQADTGPEEPPRVLELRQSLNVPPAIYAIGEGGSARMLHDLAPHARDRQLGRVEAFFWNDSSGRKWEGILAWPAEYDPDLRYPVVIQTHGFARGAFFAEGPTTTAFPGRAATERGFLVLTIRENREAMFGTAGSEPENVLDGYKTAITELRHRGLADAARVGIIGWSRTSFHVKYALTAAPDLFTAAVAADGVDYGYDHYLHTVDLFGNESDENWNRLYGGAPYSNWEQWIKTSPAFNVDKVKAPFRAEANSGREALLSEWEFYAGLRKLGKPAELWVYPEGGHSLLRPLERRTSQEGSLDWLDYWLNNRRDDARKKRVQYERWDALRAERDARVVSIGR